jgi:hypothetical protein
MREAYHSPALPSAASDPSMIVSNQFSTSSGHMSTRLEDRGSWQAGEKAPVGNEFAPDSHDNKGFSSVLVQNVHALARLPHMMDGTSDAQRRSAKSMLAAVTSPRLMLRPSPTSGAWYGPHSREVRGRVHENNDDVFRPQQG